MARIGKSTQSRLQGMRGSCRHALPSYLGEVPGQGLTIVCRKVSFPEHALAAPYTTPEGRLALPKWRGPSLGPWKKAPRASQCPALSQALTHALLSCRKTMEDSRAQACWYWTPPSAPHSLRGGLMAGRLPTALHPISPSLVSHAANKQYICLVHLMSLGRVAGCAHTAAAIAPAES